LDSTLTNNPMLIKLHISFYEPWTGIRARGIQYSTFYNEADLNRWIARSIEAMESPSYRYRNVEITWEPWDGKYRKGE